MKRLLETSLSFDRVVCEAIISFQILTTKTRVTNLAVIRRSLVRAFKLTCRLRPRSTDLRRLHVRKQKTWLRARQKLSTGDDDVPDI